MHINGQSVEGYRHDDDGSGVWVYGCESNGEEESNGMMLNEKVAMLLKARGRTLFWLAEEMGKNVDGLRLLIQRGTLNYNDIIVMAEVLGVKPGVFFEDNQVNYY